MLNLVYIAITLTCIQSSQFHDFHKAIRERDTLAKKIDSTGDRILADTQSNRRAKAKAERKLDENALLLDQRKARVQSMYGRLKSLPREDTVNYLNFLRYKKEFEQNRFEREVSKALRWSKKLYPRKIKLNEMKSDVGSDENKFFEWLQQKNFLSRNKKEAIHERFQALVLKDHELNDEIQDVKHKIQQKTLQGMEKPSFRKDLQKEIYAYAGLLKSN